MHPSTSELERIPGLVLSSPAEEVSLEEGDTGSLKGTLTTLG